MDEEPREKLKALGRELRSKREELGLSLEDVAQATKIRRLYIEAVEAGDDSIPVGKAYFRAFIKSYAGFLGLDPMEYSRRYARIALEEGGESQERTRSSGPARPGQPETPRDEERLPEGSHEAQPEPGRVRLGSKKKIPILLLCAALLVAAAMVVGRNSGLFVGTPASRSERGGVSPSPPPGEGASPPTAPSAAPAEPEGELELEITKEKIDRETIGFAVKADSLMVVVKTLPVDDGRCWVRAACDGRVVFEATLEPGSEKKFEASQEISLRLGKPWVVNLSVNGKDLGQAGPFGPVLNIVFKAKGPS